MRTLIVHESMYGNTRAIAEAVADGLAAAGHVVTLLPVADAPDTPDADLLVVGGPTHMHGLTTSMTRHMAVKVAKDEGHHFEPGAASDDGLWQWLNGLPQGDGAPAAAFATRGDGNPILTGSADRGIARRLRRRGYTVVATESYLVEGAEGPLKAGELDRARAWASGLTVDRRPVPAI
jgi:hypothetical protein